ncbi:MAG: HAD hydrolase family protein [Bacteroidales bacterium]|nr:HAD hydrolase family protein [Clostridium sp.]MCM1203502.1 HAD hydrolase family protein [Bacteroidales bacterium]
MKTLKKLHLPGIGMRIVKSAIAVLICYVVNIIRGEQGIVFYSQLAALWCVQMYQSNTRQNAVQRTVGTVIGAVYGLVYLLLYPLLTENIPGEQWIEAGVVSCSIILVLYTTVLLNKKQASYFSCVVFLSIVVNHVRDINPYQFVWNRFLDTMIGIAVGILVNDIHLCLHPDRETLFVSGLDDTLLNQKEVLSPFSKVELNRMIDNGMKFTISTMRTPAALLEAMRDVRLKLPVIAMDGAVLYDTNKHSYLRIFIISRETSQKLMGLILREGLCWYANVIMDDVLVIFYGDVLDDVNVNLLEKMRRSPLRNYVRRPLPEGEDVTYFMLLDREEKIKAFYQILEDGGFLKELKILTYPSDDYPGYAYIKIYNKNATKENMIMYLKQMTGIEQVVTFGTIPGKYDVVISADDANEVVRRVRGMYEPIIKK